MVNGHFIHTVYWGDRTYMYMYRKLSRDYHVTVLFDICIHIPYTGVSSASTIVMESSSRSKTPPPLSALSVVTTVTALSVGRRYIH